MKFTILLRAAVLYSCIITSIHISAMEKSTVQSTSNVETVPKDAIYHLIHNLKSEYPTEQLGTVVTQLHERRAKFNYQDQKTGFSVLHAAITNNNVSADCLKMLLNKGTKISHKYQPSENSQELKPLTYACLSGNAAKAAVLLEYMKEKEQNTVKK